MNNDYSSVYQYKTRVETTDQPEGMNGVNEQTNSSTCFGRIIRPEGVPLNTGSTIDFPSSEEPSDTRNDMGAPSERIWRDGAEEASTKAIMEIFDTIHPSGEDRALLLEEIIERAQDATIQNDETGAAYYHTMAADLGHESSICSIALDYYLGSGVTKDSEKALEYLDKVTDEKFKLFQKLIRGQIHAEKGDYDEAIEDLLAATSISNEMFAGSAYCFLGWIFQSAEGFKNVELARTYYQEALNRGCPGAQEGLDSLNQDAPL